MTPIRVILVDDHPIVRSGIRGMLEKANDIDVVGEANRGEEVLRMLEQTEADVILLDMDLPDIPGTQVAQLVRQNHPEIKILSLSAYDDPTFVRELLGMGASGYLLKDEAPEVIVDAVRGVANGQQGWVSRGIAAQMASWVQEGHPDGRKLTTREEETLRLLVEGLTNLAIANELHISEKTVEKYIKMIFEKLNVSSRVEAAVLAVRAGLVKR